MNRVVIQKTPRGTKNYELDRQAYEYLKKKIILCELEPGQSIVENDISMELNISRTPVRAALKKLENENLVKLFPGKGAFVTDVTTQDIEELFQYRQLLECEALKKYIQDVPDISTDKYIEQFSKFQRMEKFSEEYHHIDLQFHMEIMRYIRNSRMLATYMQLCDQIDRLRHMAAQDESRLRSTLGEHLLILEEVKKRDYERAREALANHLKNVKGSTMAAFSMYIRENK